MRSLLLLLALMLPAGAAFAEQPAEHPAECRVAEHLAETSFPLPQVTRAIAAKKLAVLVIGAGSSRLPGPGGGRTAYPARLQAALAAALPGVAVTVATDVKLRRTAAQMVEAMPADLAAAKPALLVWQTGTVDAMEGVDQDQFADALDKGINIARAAGADVILINAQYSPRTESMIALGSYAENLRWVAVQKEVPLFDRFAIMKLWADLGTFNFYKATKKLDMAERVHDCIGRLLSDLVLQAARPQGASPTGLR
jgi:hypothetical protein